MIFHSLVGSQKALCNHLATKESKLRSQTIANKPIVTHLLGGNDIQHLGKGVPDDFLGTHSVLSVLSGFETQEKDVKKVVCCSRWIV